jgi:hypothetical protein
VLRQSRKNLPPIQIITFFDPSSRLLLTFAAANNAFVQARRGRWRQAKLCPSQTRVFESPNKRFAVTNKRFGETNERFVATNSAL